jgi:hypothetical protein
MAWFVKLNSNKLVSLFVVTTPFSAATLLEFKGSNFGLLPAFFVSLLLIFTLLFRSLLNRVDIYLTGAQKTYVFSFLAMWLLYLCSLFFPVIFAIFGVDYNLFNPAFSDKNYSMDIPIYTITQFIYFSLYLFAAFAVMLEVKSIIFAKKLLSLFFKAAAFTVCWGWFFYLYNFFAEYYYPDWLFNNHPGYSQGFDLKFASLTRMSSVAQEPSVFGYFLSILLSMCIAFNALEFYVFKYVFQKIFTGVLFLTAIFTTSSTAYIGVAVSLLVNFLFAGLFNNAARFTNATVKNLSLSFFVVGVIYITAPHYLNVDVDGIGNALYELTFDKSSTGSGDERAYSFYHGLDVLVSTFYFGSGFGSNRNFDLVSTLLSNTGVVGFVLFIFSFGLVIFNSLYVAKLQLRQGYSLSDCSKIQIGLSAGLVTAIVLMFISIPDFVNMYFWLILGMLMAMSGFNSRSARPTNLTGDVLKLG